MRPWIPMLAALVPAMALGCSVAGDSYSVEADAGSAASDGTSPNGTFRCDGQRAQQLDAASGQWVDAGSCGVRAGTGSVLHWSGGAWRAGSAVLLGQAPTGEHRVLAGAGDDVWWLSRRSEGGAEHAMLFHWDGTWWTELYDWAKFAPSGVVRDAVGGVWVYGQRQVFWDATSFQLVPSLLHVAPTRDHWRELWLFDQTDEEKGSSGLVVDMQATRDGTIWAAGQRPIMGDGIVLRLVGPVWEETPYSGGVPSSIVADGASDAWVTTDGVGVFRWDGAAWTNTWRGPYGTAPGRAAGFGWLTSGYHWDGTSWRAPDASFPGGFDVAFVRASPVGFASPDATELLGIFALGDPASGSVHSEVWSYDGARWTKDTSALATGIEAAGGALTAVAGDSAAELWIAPTVPYTP